MRAVPVKTEEQQSRPMVVKQYDAHIKAMAKDGTAAQQPMQLMGVGQTTATAIVAMVGNGAESSGGRQFVTWIGLVPTEYSSGGKTRLGRITKAGDAYLLSLLVLGARAVLNAVAAKTDSLSRWAIELSERGGYRKAVVAAIDSKTAAKNARMAWRCSPKVCRSSCQPESGTMNPNISFCFIPS